MVNTLVRDVELTVWTIKNVSHFILKSQNMNKMQIFTVKRLRPPPPERETAEETLKYSLLKGDL